MAYIITYNSDKKKAEDIVQEAFINFWNNRDKIDKDKSPKSYLYKIAFNKFIDTVNKHKKEQLFLKQIWKSSLDDVIDEDESIVEKKIKKVNEIISDLPPRCKQIIKLNKMQGLKYKEIAIKLGVSLKTVESQMRIAFQKIRKEFEDDSHFFFFFILDKMRQKNHIKDNFNAIQKNIRGHVKKLGISFIFDQKRWKIYCLYFYPNPY